MRKIVPFLVLALALAAGASKVTSEERPFVHAEQGGIAAGGSMIGNTIYQENPETLKLLAKTIADKNASEDKRREAEVKVAELSAKLGFTSQAVTEFFKILGEQAVPDEKVPTRLIDIATHFAATRDQLAALEPDDPRAAELTTQAKGALDKGQLAEADALLGRAKELEAAALREARKLKQRAQEAEDRHALNLAKMEASQGDIALTQLRYKDAAEHFRQAVAGAPETQADTRWGYLTKEADALYRQGDEFGDNAALTEAIKRYRYLAELRPREASPSNWVVTQNNLGNALETLGERESGTRRSKRRSKPIVRRCESGLRKPRLIGTKLRRKILSGRTRCWPSGAALLRSIKSNYWSKGGASHVPQGTPPGLVITVFLQPVLTGCALVPRPARSIPSRQPIPFRSSLPSPLSAAIHSVTAFAMQSHR
jgi:tetratricopeptide (TPR) repeat protein